MTSEGTPKVTVEQLHDLIDRAGTVLAAWFTDSQRTTYEVGVIDATELDARGARIVWDWVDGEQWFYTHEKVNEAIAATPSHCLEPWDWERYADHATVAAIVTMSR